MLDAWVRSKVVPAGPLDFTRHRPWASVARVPLASGGSAWLKACRPVQAFEPRLTGQLHQRWPNLLVDVLAWDEERAWLLTADAGRPLGDLGNPPELWERLLPRYAELQKGERAHVADHLAHGVTDLRAAALPTAYAAMLAHDLPISDLEVAKLRRFERQFEVLCSEVAAESPGDTVQHDDLHLRSVFARGDELRILDWGDAWIGHGFASLVVTFRSLEETNGLPPGDPWFVRLRDAYLEPWGSGLSSAFERAVRVGEIAHVFGLLRHRDAMAGAVPPAFDEHLTETLRRAIAPALERVNRSERTTLSP